MLNLETRNVSLNLGASTVVRDVSLTLRAGEMLVLVGPNGAGKSSLLRLLSGEVNPSSGDIFLNGEPLQKWSRRCLARTRAVVPQNARLDFAFQVFEVVLMGRLPHLNGGIETSKDYRIAFAALERVQASKGTDREGSGTN
jgi:iron complex transport system ATP-binding protein